MSQQNAVDDSHLDPSAVKGHYQSSRETCLGSAD